MSDIWPHRRTSLGFIIGTLLIIGPAYKPNEENDLRPLFDYWVLSIADATELFRWSIENDPPDPNMKLF